MAIFGPPKEAIMRPRVVKVNVGRVAVAGQATKGRRRKADDLSVGELALSLIHLSGGVVPGALYMQKMAFLAGFEGGNATADLRRRLGYRPLNFGPFSETLRHEIQSLGEKKLVISKTQFTDKYNREIFYLSDKGRDCAQRILNDLDEESRDYLVKICSAAKQLGYSGLLRYVYSNYERFTSKSEIRDEVYDSFLY